MKKLRRSIAAGALVLLTTVSAWAVTYLGSDAIFHAIGFSDLPNINANSVFGNPTSAGAPGTSEAVPSCSGANNALIYTTNSGFGCNSISLSLAAPTYTRLTTGTSQTYTPPNGVVRIKVRMCGGGGGGGAATANNGSPGVDTSFGSWTAIHGNGGITAATASSFAAGGTGGVNAGTLINRQDGESGRMNYGASNASPGGSGPSGGSGAAGNSTAGLNAVVNSCSGGGGGASASSSGNGGGAGESVEFAVTSPAATTYTVGGGGNGGAAGTNAGGNGAAGIILIEEFKY